MASAVNIIDLTGDSDVDITDSPHINFAGTVRTEQMPKKRSSEEQLRSENANKRQRTDGALPRVHAKILRVLTHDLKPKEADVRWLERLGHVRALTSGECKACYDGLVASMREFLRLSTDVNVEGTSERIRAVHVATLLFEAYAMIWASPKDEYLQVCCDLLRKSESTFSTAVTCARIELVFRSLEDAREYMHAQADVLKRDHWHAWCRDGNRPEDIPRDPNKYYAGKGWVSWPDFLDPARAGVRAQGAADRYRSFEDAREYMHAQADVLTRDQWRDWCRDDKRPEDIPGDPQAYYEGKGWESWPDFLDPARAGVRAHGAADKFRSFEDAREYMHAQADVLTLQRWHAWCRDDKRPKDIPSNPNRTYEGKGWESWPDFLDPARAGVRAQGAADRYRSFEDAREYMHAQADVLTRDQWRDWCRDDNRPEDIPGDPQAYYAGKGWESWPDFLDPARAGVRVQGAADKYRSFEDAREYMHAQADVLTLQRWHAWCRDDKRPKDIPSNPNKYYAGKGWESWPDFLDPARAGVRAQGAADRYRSFEDAREYMHAQADVLTRDQWRDWCRDDKRPKDIPGDPEKYYAGKGWESWPDFLDPARAGKAKRIHTGRRLRLS
ncbi:methyltransferase [Pycnococcus provasolii]